jgi:UPF0176 protein
MNKSGHTIILFYKYTYVEDPTALMGTQKEICTKLGLTGRGIIAHEGINMTFEGVTENIELYVKDLLSDPRFANIHIKKSEGTGSAFPKLSIKVRNEIVTLGLGEQDFSPTQVTGKHLPPEELHRWFAEGKKFEIVDMRNDYEHALGHFKGSILPPLENFRDLPKALPTLDPIKGKTVLTVCTGGVRCEKASGYLVKQGFKDVYQLDGGIVSYMEKYMNDDFQGKLYVFDNRVGMTFTPDEKRTIVGKCLRCASSSENYVNCAYLMCHKHFICCNDCLEDSGEAFCSDKCERMLETSRKSANVYTV